MTRPILTGAPSSPASANFQQTKAPAHSSLSTEKCLLRIQLKHWSLVQETGFVFCQNEYSAIKENYIKTMHLKISFCTMLYLNEDKSV